MGMEADSSSFPSSSSSSTAQRKYDVFLSFRGEDTRSNFMDHLFNALKGKGIHTFRDSEELKKGKAIGTKLLEAIKESKFAIIILLKDYASSTWCLDELAHIIFCKEENVDPSDVQKQRKTFEQAFVEYEKRENKERVEKWRVALRQSGQPRSLCRSI